jgi:broad specificity phosphatase PhoE
MYEVRAMSQLILVRHAAPIIDPARSSAEWTLSEEGREAARRLARRLASYAAKAVLSGPEPKVAETAEILGHEMTLPVAVLPALAEHERRSSRYVPKAEFEAAIRRLFLEPGAIVYGEESADMTCRRFASALDDARRAHGDATTIAVSGGTAICLYIARQANVDGFGLWETLDMPIAFVLSGDGSKIEEVLQL